MEFLKALADLEAVDDKRKQVALEVKYLDEKLNEVLESNQYDKSIFMEKLEEDSKMEYEETEQN